MDRPSPLASVVVPTFERPDLVLRAVRSALGQTLSAIEVIVVVDGRDEGTIEALSRIIDFRLRVIVPERHLGNADARNLGIGAARSRWVAFLDDDDEWMPPKLAAQLHTAERSPHRHPVVSCRFIARNGREDFTWPRRYPRQNEPISEYLFCRATPFMGEGIVQTSTIFTARELMQRVPFTSGMRRYVDLDWLLRASTVEGVGLEFVTEREPLSVWRMEDGRARICNAGDGAYSLAWARARRHLFTPRSYASFLLTLASASAAQGGEQNAFLPLALEAYRHGTPSGVDALTHIVNFAMPLRLARSSVWRRIRAPLASRVS